jgi:hypothetical protein
MDRGTLREIGVTEARMRLLHVGTPEFLFSVVIVNLTIQRETIAMAKRASPARFSLMLIQER